MDMKKNIHRKKEECVLSVLSLGAGVQSTVLACMMAKGEVKAPDCAIFADTGWEPKGVYKHLDWLETQLPFPLHRVSVGHKLQDFIRERKRADGSKGYIEIPFFNLGTSGKTTFMMRRQCTRQYKIVPIRRKIREIMGYPGGAHIPRHLRVKQSLGISVDEFTRMKDSDVKFIINTYPLIDMMMSRQNCLNWWNYNYPNMPLQKSSCVGCPFHSIEEWVRIRDTYPEQFEESCEIDNSIRDIISDSSPSFLHRRAMPLREAVELDSIALNTRSNHNQLSLLDAECSGYCGV